MKRIISAVCALVMSAAVGSAATARDEGRVMITADYKAVEDMEEHYATEQLYDSRPYNLRRMEYLGRGLTAVPSDDGVLVSWRFLGTDPYKLKYYLYRDDERINEEPLTITNYFDKEGKPGSKYTLRSIEHGLEYKFEAETVAWDKGYISFDLRDHGSDYNIDDAAIGDLDGD